MLPTPSTSHVSFDSIYEPAEDSFLVLDTLSLPAETTFLKERFPPDRPSPLLLEIGTGSGVILAFVTANAAALFGRSDLSLLGTDINILAARASHRTAERSLPDGRADRNARPGLLDTLAADLAGPIKDHEIDVLIFNPPYVPTESLPAGPESGERDSLSAQDVREHDSKLLELSYAGGADGMEVTNRLLEQMPSVLSSRGVAYVLLCAQNKPEDVKARVRDWPGEWSAETVGSSGKKAGWERLSIVRVWRT